MLWLYINFPQLQLDTLYQAHDSAAPTVIIDTSDNGVVQYDTQAQSHGITIGQSLGSAAALCPKLRVIGYCSDTETRQLEYIADACYQYIADIALMPPQGLLLRITPMLKIYQDVERCWQAIKPCIERVTSHYRVAVAYSAMAAQCLAREPVKEQQDNDKGVITLECDTVHINQQLANVSLSTTELSHQVVQNLSHIGINRLGQLLNIPLQELAQRFDIDVVNTLGKITGQLRAEITFYQPSTQFYYYLELHFDMQSTSLLKRPVLHVLAKLEQYLVFRELLASQVQLTLILRDKPSQTIDINSAQGEQQRDKLFELCTLILDNIKLMAPVIALELRTVLLVEKQTVSGDIFNPAATSSNQLSPAQLISLLQAKLNKEHVQSLSHHLEHAPEVANAQHVIKTIAPQQAQSHDFTLLRPSYLLATPQPWREPVSIIHGPERIQTHWWTTKSIARDYYIVKNSQQQWCWLFKQSDGRWFIHGYFG